MVAPSSISPVCSSSSALEPRVGEIERDADERDPIGAAPGVGQVEPGLETDTLGLQLTVQTPGEGRDGRAFDAQGEIRDPHIEKFVADRVPTLHQGANMSVRHYHQPSASARSGTGAIPLFYHTASCDQAPSKARSPAPLAPRR